MSYITAYLKDTSGNLLHNRAIAAGGQTTECALPTTWGLIANIYVTIHGDSTTDAATLNELKSQITNLRILTLRGEEVLMTGFDLYDWPAWQKKGAPTAALRIGAAADQENALTWCYPLSLAVDKWNNFRGQYFGLPGWMSDRVILELGTDAAAGSDSRDITVEAEGLMGVEPISYSALYRYNYTSVAGEWHSIPAPIGSVLAGVYGFTTTNFNVDTTAVVLGVQELALVKNETPVMFTDTITRQFGIYNEHSADPVAGERVQDEHFYWPIDPTNEGSGYWIDPDTEVRALGGTAEAVRIYRHSHMQVPTNAK